MLCYSKSTCYSGINRGQISRRIGGYNSTWVILDSVLSNLGLKIRAKFHYLPQEAFTLTVILERLRTGLVFVLRLITIFGFHHRTSTQPRSQTFKIRLKNESWVGTPFCWNLTKSNTWFHWVVLLISDYSFLDFESNN